MVKTVVLLIASVMVGCILPTAGQANLNVTATQWSPVDIPIDNVSYSGNPFEVIATTTFTHGPSGETRTSQIFYAGGNTWKIRFTGSRPGLWTFTTSSSNSNLNGLSGNITIDPAEANDYGFILHQGNRWARQKGSDGTLEALVPQFVMYPDPDLYYNDPARIDADIQTLLVQHGFNGVHTRVYCRWFDINRPFNNQYDEMDPNPDFRTFESLELLISKIHAAGGVVHIWAWGDDSRKQTPVKWGINGTVDRRLQRYIAARLGPLPGWTMGYGYDLPEWVNTEQLCSWHSYMQQHFGWMHYLGGRSHKNQLTQICETLDYSSYEQHKPDYAKYVETIEARPHKPSFSEDRFRISSTNPDPNDPYAYSELLTRRGLWDSTMAGGVANIWANLVGSPGYYCVAYQYPHWSRTYADFFLGRFILGMARDNSLTNGVCLRTADRTRYLFYRENTNSISMNLSALPISTSAVAVDTTLPYNEISLGVLQPGQHNWTAPYTSDWAIAVENHTDTQAPSIPTNVTAEAQSQWSIKVTWNASTDDTGVKHYKVYRNGSQVGTVTFPTYLDTGLNPETTYSYRISAADYAGNESAQSSPAAVATTLAMPNYCSIELGATNVSDMLIHPQNSDGDTIATTAGELECRRPINTGDQYFYFAIDDDFMYDEPGTTRYLEVCYYDDQLSSVYLQPQYDAVGDGIPNIYRSASNVNFTDTGKWRTATWTLTECRFANRQNASSDFRIGIGPNDVKISSVRVSKIPFGNHVTVERDLGPREVYRGLSHPQVSGGNTTVTTIEGKDCRKPTASGDNYFYFNVSDAIVYNGNPSTVHLKVIYYDSPGGMIQPQYDSTSGAYTDAATVSFTGTNSWKQAIWTLSNVRFANSQNGSADFRLFVGTDQSVHIDKVIMSKQPFEEDTEPPSVPTNVQATGQSMSSILVTWNASTDNFGVAGYKIFRNGNQVGNSATTSYTDTGLEVGTTYSYTVSAYDAAGNESAQSSPPAVGSTHGPDVEPPSVPTGTVATAESSTTVSLTWNASTDNIAVEGYRIYRNGSLSGTSDTTGYTDTGLEPSTTYSYTVSAYDTAGNESAQSSPPATVTMPDADTEPPSVPTNVTATAQSGSEILVAWTASTDNVGVTGYKIFRNGSLAGTTDTTSYSDTGLEPQTTYSYTVSAYDVEGNESEQSPILAVATTHGAFGTMHPIADSFTRRDTGSTNFGNRNPIEFKVKTDSRRRYMWFKFTFDNTPVTSATFSIYQWHRSGGGTVAQLRAAEAVGINDFDEYSITWNNQPGGESDTWGTQIAPNQTWVNEFTGWRTYDITNYYNNNLGKTVTFRIRGESSVHSNHYEFTSREGTTNQPKLVYSGFVDAQAPSVPGNVQASGLNPGAVSITWAASTDNVGVAGYRVYRNGTHLATVTGTSYVDTGLAPGSTYSYTVSAFDAAGNSSNESSPATIATTMAGVNISAAKELVDNSPAGLASKVITAVFSDYIYVEEVDRSSGIRVVPTSSLAGLSEGMHVDIGGSLQTADGERRITEAIVTVPGG